MLLLLPQWLIILLNFCWPGGAFFVQESFVLQHASAIFEWIYCMLIMLFYGTFAFEFRGMSRDTLIILVRGERLQNFSSDSKPKSEFHSISNHHQPEVLTILWLKVFGSSVSVEIWTHLKKVPEVHQQMLTCIIALTTDAKSVLLICHQKYFYTLKTLQSHCTIICNMCLFWLSQASLRDSPHPYCLF